MQRGVRIRERNSAADTEVSGRRGGAVPGAGADSPAAHREGHAEPLARGRTVKVSPRGTRVGKGCSFLLLKDPLWGNP